MLQVRTDSFGGEGGHTSRPENARAFLFETCTLVLTKIHKSSSEKNNPSSICEVPCYVTLEYVAARLLIATIQPVVRGEKDRRKKEKEQKKAGEE